LPDRGVCFCTTTVPGRPRLAARRGYQVSSYGSKDNKSKGSKTEKGSGSKGNDQPVLYPTTHRPKGKGSQGHGR
jgi:hypothetical protein